MIPQDKGFMEALIDGKWIKYDLDGESRDSYKDIKDKEYLGNGCSCRHVEDGKYYPQSGVTGHIWRFKAETPTKKQ